MKSDPKKYTTFTIDANKVTFFSILFENRISE